MASWCNGKYTIRVLISAVTAYLVVNLFLSGVIGVFISGVNSGDISCVKFLTLSHAFFTLLTSSVIGGMFLYTSEVFRSYIQLSSYISRKPTERTLSISRR